MIKITNLISFVIPFAICACNSEAPRTETVAYYDIVDKFESNGKIYLLTEHDDNHTAVEVTSEQMEVLNKMSFFEISYEQQKDRDGKATNIKQIAEDTTKKRQLFVTDDEAIEDFKRKKTGSYTIIERPNKDGFIVVNTPGPEISKMIRTEAYKFYYYKNWDGKYYYDHIEDGTDNTTETTDENSSERLD